MKIFFPFDFADSHRNFMRRAGYGEFNDPNTGITSYTKRLSGYFYPRFHVYLEQNKDNRWVINLHLDQKKPSYPGSRAHNAEYDGETVEREGSRLEGLIKNQMDNQSQSDENQEKKGFFSKLFS